MIHAYRETLLNKAQKALGEAFDYAENFCGVSADDFALFFAFSQVGYSFSKGESKYVLGKSGPEIVVDVLDIVFDERPYSKEYKIYNPSSYSETYWAGWVIAFYQWWTAKSFKEIFSSITFSHLYILHNLLNISFTFSLLGISSFQKNDSTSPNVSYFLLSFT